jgi:hypothetical protein
MAAEASSRRSEHGRLLCLCAVRRRLSLLYKGKDFATTNLGHIAAKS